MEIRWGYSFANRWIGRFLKRYCLEAGLAGVDVFSPVSVIDDFEFADCVYNLRLTAQRAAAEGRVTPLRGRRTMAYGLAGSEPGG
jgi:hypothetical protein